MTVSALSSTIDWLLSKLILAIISAGHFNVSDEVRHHDIPQQPRVTQTGPSVPGGFGR